MIGAKRLTPAIAVLLLAASVAWSQSGADAESEATTTTQQQSPGADADNGDAARDTTPTQTDRSPTDYRSSEEISEDLSVSFPVDI
jgi:hypothetical protein